jgi:hypothetical protein
VFAVIADAMLPIGVVREVEYLTRKARYLLGEVKAGRTCYCGCCAALFQHVKTSSNDSAAIAQ